MKPLFLFVLLLVSGCEKARKLSENTNQNTADVSMDEGRVTFDRGAHILAREPFAIKASMNRAIKWKWEQVEGPGTVTITNPNAAETIVSADRDGTYKIRVTAEGDNRISGVALMKLVWDTTGPAIVLTEQFRAFRKINLGARVEDGVSYQWEILSGPEGAKFSEPEAMETAFEAAAEGTYQLRLTAKDEAGNSSSRSCEVIWSFQSPTVALGADRFASKKIGLKADVNGGSSYQWSQQSGPGTLVFSSAQALETEVESEVEGVFVVRLTAVSENGKESFDEITLTFDLQAPTISFPTKLLVKSEGYWLDPQVDGAVDIQWSLVEPAPAGATLLPPGSRRVLFQTSKDGRYLLKLVATDLAGNSTTHQVNVDVQTAFKVKTLAASGSTSCAIDLQDELRCWGRTVFPHAMTRLPSVEPIRFPAGKTPKLVAPAERFMCALFKDESMSCWGNNYAGELGLGHLDVQIQPPTSTINFGEGFTVKTVATGSAHVCAILNDGGVRCWGLNDQGQLGTGDTVNRLMPASSSIDLGAGRSATDLAVGSNYTCALLDNATVKCWGAILFQTPEEGSSPPLVTLPPADPINFGEGKTALSIHSNVSSACAILSDKSIACWGTRSIPDSGSVSVLSSTTPAAGDIPVSMSLGPNHSCILLESKKMKCWGLGDNGKLGLGRLENFVSPDSAIDFGSDRTVMAMALGHEHSCALLDDASLRCWGSNTFGQLGIGHDQILTKPTATPLAFPANRTAADLALSVSTSCALLDNSRVTCWGRVIGSGTHYGLPFPSSEFVKFPGDLAVSQVGLGAGFGCGLMVNGLVHCWGRSNDSYSATALTQAVNFGSEVTVRSLSSGPNFSCAIASDDSIRCWGYSHDPSVALSAGEAKIPEKVSVGRTHACILLTDRSVKCFGQSGALGLGDSVFSLPAPGDAVPLGAGRTAVQVASGDDHSCALLDNGSVKCWGTNNFGQLGYGSTPYSTPPEKSINFGPGRKVKAIAVGAFHSCALMEDQSMRCWGRGAEGQLGTGTQENRSFPPPLPITFAGNKKVRSIHAAHNQSCAILEDRSVRCWGDGKMSTLGIPTAAVWSPRQEPISFRPAQN